MTDKQHDTRQPRNIQQQERRASGREGKEGKARKGGRREGRGWPRAWRVEEGNEEEHDSRQGAERDQTDRGKKERYKYLRERREKNAAETRKSMQVYVYTYHLISWRGGCLLHFLLYI